MFHSINVNFCIGCIHPSVNSKCYRRKLEFLILTSDRISLRVTFPYHVFLSCDSEFVNNRCNSLSQVIVEHDSMCISYLSWGTLLNDPCESK